MVLRGARPECRTRGWMWFIAWFSYFLTSMSTAPCHFSLTKSARCTGQSWAEASPVMVKCLMPAAEIDQPGHPTRSKSQPTATKYVREDKMTRRRTSFPGSSICQAGLPGPVDPHDRARISDLHGSSCRHECREIDRSRKPSLDLNPSGCSPMSRTPSPPKTHKEHGLNMG